MGVVRSKLGLKLVVLAALLAGAAAPARAAEQPPKPARIDRNGVMILVRSTLIALDQANKTGNYTVLRDLGSPAFQANSAARLGEIFAGLRHESLDLSGVAVLDPELTLLRQIDAEGMMRMTGFFPSAGADQFRSRLRAGQRAVAALRHHGGARSDRPGGARPSRAGREARAA